MNSSFVLFAIEIRHAGRTWVVWRRYRQFEQVRKALMSKVAAARRPLPPKGIGLHMTSKQASAERRAALEAWLQPVMQEGAALAHPAFLDFIGFPGPECETKSSSYSSPVGASAEITERHRDLPDEPKRGSDADTPRSRSSLAGSKDVARSLPDWLDSIKLGCACCHSSCACEYPTRARATFLLTFRTFRLRRGAIRRCI